MENVIFKLKIGTRLDPKNSLPSERRYSASLVLGFSVIFVCLFIVSTAIGIVVIHKIQLYKNLSDERKLWLYNHSTVKNNSENNEDALQTRILKDLVQNNNNFHFNNNLPALMYVSCFLMSLGYFLSACTGALAWKRWFIDNNITYFFLCSLISILTTCLSLVLVLLHYLFTESIYSSNNYSPISSSITIFMIILSFSGLLWSFLASKIAFSGMKNGYPDEHSIARTNKEFSEINKSNKNIYVVPQEFLSQFSGNTINKHFPKSISDNSLPKPESNNEYQERVNKFLSGNCNQIEKL